MLISEWRGHAAPRRAIEKSDLNQVWFDNFFDRISLFLNRRRQSAQANRSAFKLLDLGERVLAILFSGAVGITPPPFEPSLRYTQCVPAFVFTLSIVPPPPQQPVYVSGVPPPPPRNLARAAVFDFHSQNSR